MNRKRRIAAPYAPPPDAPLLEEVWRRIAQLQVRLDTADDHISVALATLERKLVAMGIDKVISVKLPDGADLGWSYDRRHRRWRFVIRMDDDVWELRSCSREERVEVLTCGAMEKLVERAKEIHAENTRRAGAGAAYASVARRQP